MIKIVFNSQLTSSPGTQFYMRGLEGFPEVRFQDYGGYEKYDIALFTSGEADYAELLKARSRSSSIKIGLVDPRRMPPAHVVDAIDFLLLDSIEMQDYYAGLGKSIFIYHEYPDFPAVAAKQHGEKETIILGYHGNAVHLRSMYKWIAPALHALSQEFSLELWAIYNQKWYGECAIEGAESVPIRHLQWTPDCYTDKLSQVDIGLVPALMPICNGVKTKRLVEVNAGLFLDTESDYLTRYKMPSNPGRILVYAKLGIPVVADFLPSALQMIQDGDDGLLACHSGGWYAALHRLITSPSLRQQLADRLRRKFDTQYSFPVQNARLKKAFIDMLAGNAHNFDAPVFSSTDSVEKQVFAVRRGKKVKKWLHSLLS